MAAAFAARCATISTGHEDAQVAIPGEAVRRVHGMGLRRGGQLVAFAITRSALLFDSPATMFMDFGCRTGEAAALRRLVSARMDADRRAGHALAVVMGLHPQLADWRKIGFLQLPERFNPRPFNLIVKQLDGGIGALDPASWLITLGDWDVF